jgi:hypothetical protein
MCEGKEGVRGVGFGLDDGWMIMRRLVVSVFLRSILTMYKCYIYH